MYDRTSEQSQQRIAEKLGGLQDRLALEAVRHIIEFNKTPADLKAEMDRFVIGQEQGKRTICTAIAFHYRRLGNALKKSLIEKGRDIYLALRHTRTPKANILMMGPTGVGKTYTAETASDLVGVPFIKEDLTKFSEVGYVGQNASDILVDLLVSADGNPHVAQMGIVYLDEIDKIASEYTVTKDVSGKGVQKGLIKIVEGVENIIDLGRERVPLSTQHVLFIAAGTYENLGEIVQKRVASQGLKGDWHEHLHTQDLVAYGMDKQLMGRFPVRVVYNSLDTQDLMDIMLQSEGSPLKSYIQDFKAWDIDLVVNEEALTEVARRAEQEEIGARGLITILHRVLSEDMYQFPGTFTGQLLVDGRHVRERLA